MTTGWPAARCFEHHDDAYRLWRETGVSGAVLVHVDAHPDMAPCDDPAHVHIGNFVDRAAREGLVRDIYWVAPDRSFTTAAGRRRLARHFEIFAADTGAPGPVARRDGVWSIETPRGRITALPLGKLPRITAPALVDLDVDYFMIDIAPARGEFHRPAARPWIWPADVMAVLRRQVPGPSHVTIAASVAGGFVPLEWKFLGAVAADPDGPGLADLVEAAGLRLLRRYDAAVRLAMRAAGAAPDAAAPWHLAALCRQAQGRRVAAARATARAVALDPTYRGLFASDGYTWLGRRDFARARRAFAAQQARDPADAGAALGLGFVALMQRRWPAALHAFDAALALDPSLVAAHRGRGHALASLGRLDAARQAYGVSLRQALAGARMVTEPWISPADAPRRDHGHAWAHAALARVDLRQGRIREAIAGLRMAIAGGDTRPETARALARALRQ